MMERDDNACLLVVAAEASADRYGARVLRELTRLVPGLRVVGIGGDDLAAAGMEVLVHQRELAVLGVWEALGKLPRALRAMRDLISRVRHEGIRSALLLDAPDFNLPLARRLTRLGLTITYYVAPQVWAWRPGRARSMARIVDTLAVIFPFEEPLFRQAGVQATFVGHPLMDLDPPPTALKPCPCGTPTLALLPGSRPGELRRHLKPLLDGADLVASQTRARFILPVAQGLDRGAIERACLSRPSRPEVVDGPALSVLAEADLAVMASGTATVEAALAGTPAVVVYRLSYPGYLLARLFIRVRHIAMVNILAGEALLPELIQGQVKGPSIAQAALDLLRDPERYQRITVKMAEIRAGLGAAGASRRVAEMVAASVSPKAQ